MIVNPVDISKSWLSCCRSVLGAGTRTHRARPANTPVGVALLANGASPRRWAMTPALAGILTVLLSGIVFLPSSANAALPKEADFYRVEVPVSDASNVSRSKGLLEAFKIMLRRVTGAKDPTTLDGWNSIRSKPTRYTAGLRYVNRPIGQLSLYDKLKVSQYRNNKAQDNNVALDAIETSILEVSFDRVALETLMENYSWARWPVSRPKTMVLVFQRRGFREDVVTAIPINNATIKPEVIDRYTNNLDYLFARAGLGYSLPYPDWLNRHSDLIAQVKGRRFDGAAQILAREGYSELLVIRARTEGQSSFANFTRLKLTRAGLAGRSDWESYGITLEDVLYEGTQSLFNAMIADYVRDAGSLQDIDVHLEVAEVLSLDDYVRVLNYLNRMPQTAQVRVLRVSKLGVEFMLKTRGVWSDILRVFSSATLFNITRFVDPSENNLPESLPDLDADASSTTVSSSTEQDENASTEPDDTTVLPETTSETTPATTPSTTPATTTAPRQYRTKYYLHAILRH